MTELGDEKRSGRGPACGREGDGGKKPEGQAASGIIPRIVEMITFFWITFFMWFASFLAGIVASVTYRKLRNV